MNIRQQIQQSEPAAVSDLHRAELSDRIAREVDLVMSAIRTLCELSGHDELGYRLLQCELEDLEFSHRALGRLLRALVER